MLPKLVIITVQPSYACDQFPTVIVLSLHDFLPLSLMLQVCAHETFPNLMFIMKGEIMENNAFLFFPLLRSEIGIDALLGAWKVVPTVRSGLTQWSSRRRQWCGVGEGWWCTQR